MLMSYIQNLKFGNRTTVSMQRCGMRQSYSKTDIKNRAVFSSAAPHRPQIITRYDSLWSSSFHAVAPKLLFLHFSSPVMLCCCSLLCWQLVHQIPDLEDQRLPQICDQRARSLCRCYDKDGKTMQEGDKLRSTFQQLRICLLQTVPRKKSTQIQNMVLKCIYLYNS